MGVVRVRSGAGESRDLDRAAAALGGLGLGGWPLVAAAQQAVHRQFRCYSCLSWWESPATAFSRGRGYCVQYNGALAEVLRALGFDCRLVHAFRVRMIDDPSWRMGHVWVRVRIDGEVRDVCAGTQATQASAARFEPLTRVWGFGRAMQALTTLGMAPIVATSLTRTAIKRTPRATWLHHPLTN